MRKGLETAGVCRACVVLFCFFGFYLGVVDPHVWMIVLQVEFVLQNPLPTTTNNPLKDQNSKLRKPQNPQKGINKTTDPRQNHPKFAKTKTYTYKKPF